MGDVRSFVEEHHYSHSVKGITPFLCFEVVLKLNLQKQIGAIIFGAPGQIQTERKYGEYPNGKQISRPKYVAVELRRLVLLDEIPKNGESYIIGRLIQMLKHLGVDRIISYADPNQKREEHPDGMHSGLIYRASGFHKIKEAGNTKAIIMLEDFNGFSKGRRLPIRNLDQYKNFRVDDLGSPVSPNKPPQEKHLSELDLKIRLDWEKAIRDGDAVVWQDRSGGKVTFVIKTEPYLTSLSKRLREALKNNKAKMESEKGKILYIKDLKPKMPYFETPRKAKEDGTN